MTGPKQQGEAGKRRTLNRKRHAVPPAESVSSAARPDAGTAAHQGEPEAGPSGPAGDARLREAIIAAASEVGFDGTGADGLKGYLRRIANEDPKTYFGVLSKLMLGEATSSTEETVTRIERVIVLARE